MKYLTVIIIFILSACTIHDQGEKVSGYTDTVSFEDIHPDIQKKISDPKYFSFTACGPILRVFNNYVTDGPDDYYNIETGRHIANCEYWHCTEHKRNCHQCPPRNWGCSIAP